MKKHIVVSAAAASILLAAFTFTKKHVEVYKVDTQNSSLEWFAEKIGGKHNGAIALSGGEIRDNHGKLSGSFIVDMKSIVCSDLSGEWKEKLEGHLKSDDFFGVEKFPTAKFEITSVKPIADVKEGGNTHIVTGNLTIKEKTNEVSFEAVIKWEAGKIACAGTAVVDRSKFDVKYGSKTFFPNIGDKMIYDEFKVQFKILAVKSKHGH